MAELILKIPTKPFDDETKLYNRANISFRPGLTVFVGCNGSGKSTLIRLIRSQCTKNSIPVISFDNFHEGGNQTANRISHELGDMGFLASTWGHSEGETINDNLSFLSSKLRNFIHTGKVDSRQHKFSELFRPHDQKETPVPDIRVILLDGVDSGFSIDNVLETKDLFALILDDAKSIGVDVYIFVSANAYEMASGENCYDVALGKFCKFESYDAYKNFILQSRRRKDIREEKRQEALKKSE